MSSILRALKKLENDPRHLEDNQSLDHKFVPLADTNPPRSLANIIFITVGGGIICGLVFFAGWWWLFSEKNGSSPVSLPEIAQQVPSPQQKPALKEKLKSLPPSAVVEKSATKPKDQATAQIKTAPVSESENLTLQEPSFQKNTPEKAEQIQEAPRVAAETDIEVLLSKDINEEATRSLTSAETAIQPEKPETPQLTDPDMLLQALTWSREPHKRIAVINNRILHEGETVSGYLLVAINQDDVILGREGKSWKLLFRTK